MRNDRQIDLVEDSEVRAVCKHKELRLPDPDPLVSIGLALAFRPYLVCEICMREAIAWSEKRSERKRRAPSAEDLAAFWADGSGDYRRAPSAIRVVGTTEFFRALTAQRAIEPAEWPALIPSAVLRGIYAIGRSRLIGALEESQPVGSPAQTRDLPTEIGQKEKHKAIAAGYAKGADLTDLGWRVYHRLLATMRP